MHSTIRSHSYSNPLESTAYSGPHAVTHTSGLPPDPHSQSHYDDDTQGMNKKRKIDRACDACRRRKTKCDGPKMPNNFCTNCRQSKKQCTYIEASKPRGPPKAYVTDLEDKMEKLEELLKELRPEDDLSSEIGPPIIRGSWNWTEALQANERPPSSPHKSNFPSFVPNHAPPENNLYPAATNFTPVRRTTHLILDSQPLPKHPRPIPNDQYRDKDTNFDTSSSDESSNFDIVEIESISGLAQRLTLRGVETDIERPVDVRFHGKSSAVTMVDATRKFKEMHMLETAETSDQPSQHSALSTGEPSDGPSSQRPEYWQMPRWERVWEGVYIDPRELSPAILAEFPSPDLALELIDLYFVHANTLFPLLHRPTFDRQWREDLHHTNIWFAGLCTSLFAVASRWSNDPRVIKGNANLESDEPDWGLAGWSYLEAGITIFRTRQSIFYPATLFEIQTFTLMAMFLRGTNCYPTAWIIVGIGLRKAQDVGAHRQKVYHIKPSVDEELWKRAFWCLVVFDRVESATLGRNCILGEEDFDVDLPLEVDDEYWETKESSVAFKQPAGMPAKVCAFNQFIKLTQILGFASKTVYAIDKSKVFCGLTPTEWRKEVVDQLNIALSEWVNLLPKHLAWSPKIQDLAFAAEIVTLHTLYHIIRLIIYRPFISPALTSIPSLDGTLLPQTAHPSLPYPAMDICVEAARACARIAETQRQEGHLKLPILIHAAQFCAGMLLVRIWDLKTQERVMRTQGMEDIKPPLIQQIEPLLADVAIFINILERAEPRWRFVSSFLRELRESLPDDVVIPTRQPHMKNSVPRHMPFTTEPHSSLHSPLSHPQHHWQHSSASSHGEPDHSHTRDQLPGCPLRPGHTSSQQSFSEPIIYQTYPAADDPAFFKQQPIPYRSSTKRYEEQPQDFPQWPSSSQRAKDARAASLSVAPVSFAERSVPYIGSAIRQTSYPKYFDVPQQHQGSVFQKIPRYDDISDDGTNMSFDDIHGRQTMYIYPLGTSTIPTTSQTQIAPNNTEPLWPDLRLNGYMRPPVLGTWNTTEAGEQDHPPQTRRLYEGQHGQERGYVTPYNP